MNRKSVKTLFLILAFAVNALWAGTPQDSPIRYSGRVGESPAGNPVLYWSGSSIHANFEGTSLSILLNDKTGKPYYNVIIDGEDKAPAVLDLKPGKHTYAIASNLTDTAHEAQLYRRTEGTDGPTEFVGFILDDGSKLLPPPLAPKRRIAFFGDSITCGMGNEAPNNEFDESNAHRNHYLTYGSISARELDAEFHCIARSGIGMIKSWYPLIMPELWNRLDPADPNSRWDFSTWTPDVVVVNLFQNDSWLIGRMNPVPTGEEISQAYGNFISGIRDVYPGAHIVCALGSMDATKDGSPWPDYIEEAVNMMDSENISTLFFPFTKAAGHPRVKHHQKMAKQLTKHLRKQMKW